LNERSTPTCTTRWSRSTPSSTFIPALATKWETPDPKTYVFTLRTGVKFHDGSDFNADVVKFNIERDINTKTSFRRGELANVDSVEVKDPQTAIIHLKKPDSTPLSALVDRAGMMVSPKAVAAAGAEFTRAPVGAGTGPFQFVEWKNGDHLTLKKNPNYWQKGKPYLDTIIYKPITNTDSSLASLKTGDLDVVRVLSAKDVAGVKADSTLTYRELPGLNFNGFEMNETAAPFNDPKKRQAVLTAHDRLQFIKNVNFGIGVESLRADPALQLGLRRLREALREGRRGQGEGSRDRIQLQLQDDQQPRQHPGRPADQVAAGEGRHHRQHPGRGVRSDPERG